MAVDHIKRDDSLNDGRVKINAAIDQSNDAITKATKAEQDASEAKTTANSVQEQFNQVVIEGDSSVEAAQARVSADGTSYTTLKERLDSEHGQLSAQLAQTETKVNDIVINVRDFGGSENNADNHDSIISALDYLKSQNGGTLLIPEMLKTSTLALHDRDYKNIQIRGVMPTTQPWTKKAGFQFISEGAVGIQLSDHDLEIPVNRAIEITLKDLYIDCNNMVDVGINGNFGVYLDNVTVDNALQDGIVMEGMSYPFIMNRVFSRYNGRHGLYVKAPYTTVYNLYNCEFTSNEGYGMYIEDGAGATIQDTLVQSNKQGGIKIVKPNPSNYTKNVFLDNLLFISLYLENNGLLSESDPNYEGNYAIKTEGYDHTKFQNVGKIQNLTFVNIYGGTPETGKPALFQGVTKISTLGLTSFFINDSTIDYDTCGGIRGSNANDITTTFNYNPNDWSQTAKNYKEMVMYNDDNKQILKIGHGYLGMRGRMRELRFTLPNIDNGETKDMLYNGESGMVSAPIIQAGSLIALNVFVETISNGVLTFEIRYATNDRKILSNYLLLDPLTITQSNKSINSKYPLLKYKIPDNAIGIGIRVFAGGSASGITNINAHLFIES